MKRIVFDVPRWHVYLHRDARGLDTATERDGPLRRLEDELFDRLYSGETERLPEKKQDSKLREWADGVHATCEKLPAFNRLAAECRGEPIAAGIAVETLMADLGAQVPDAPEEKPPETIRRIIGSACQKASQAVDELRETAEGLSQVGFARIPGTGTATGGMLPAGSIRALAARLRSDARLKQIALLAGRFKRIAAAKRRQKLRHGADEIADIEMGADLGRLLPSELIKLANPALRGSFMRNLIERSALGYQLTGNAPLGKGPLVVLLDKSGSMDGPRDVWATALALALLDEAQRERRTYALLGFDCHVKHEAVVTPGEPLAEHSLFTACAGGTDIAVAVERGLELIRKNEVKLKRADIILVTDGGSDTSSAAALRSRALSMGVTILGLGIGVEREWVQPWCDEVHVVTDLSRIDDTAAEKLFAA